MPPVTPSMRRASLLGWLAAVTIAAVGVGLEWRRIPAVFTTSGVIFIDPDDDMRLCRVRSIIEGGPAILRHDAEVNWPRGVEMHWTAPLDYVLVGAVTLFGGLTKETDRIAGVAAWAPLWMGLAYSLVMMAMIRRACGWGPALLAGLMIVLSPAYHRVFPFGHPDHQCLLELLFAIAVSAWVPWRDESEMPRIPSRRCVILGGAAIGLALWTASQALPIWGAILVGATYASFHASPECRATWAARRREWSLAVLAVVVCGYFIENKPNLGEIAIDKISLFYVALAILSLFVPSGGPGPSAKVRWATFVIAAAIVVGGSIAEKETLFRYVSGDALFRWWSIVAELLPLYTHVNGRWSLVPLQQHLGYEVYALPVLLLFFVRSKTMPCGAKFMFALMALGMTGCVIYQRRWLDHVNLGVVPVTVVGAWEMIRVVGTRRSSKTGERIGPPPWERFLATAVVIGILCYPCAAGFVRAPISDTDIQGARAAFVAERIDAYESAHPTKNPSRRAILCDEGIGPMLHYRTRLPVVAVPYHRAIDGIVAAAKFFAERDPLAARRMLDALGVRYVVVPYRPHEQLINFERIAFGELKSYDPPEQSLDEQGNVRERLKYRPEITETAIYRLTLHGGGGIPGLELIESVAEGATTPDGKSGLLYVVKDLNGDAR